MVLEENDISGLVEVSSLLGCIGDMLKEPVVLTHQVREHVQKTCILREDTQKGYPVPDLSGLTFKKSTRTKYEQKSQSKVML